MNIADRRNILEAMRLAAHAAVESEEARGLSLDNETDRVALKLLLTNYTILYLLPRLPREAMETGLRFDPEGRIAGWDIAGEIYCADCVPHPLEAMELLIEHDIDEDDAPPVTVAEALMRGVTGCKECGKEFK